jgi:hypothetical protein
MHVCGHVHVYVYVYVHVHVHVHVCICICIRIHVWIGTPVLAAAPTRGVVHGNRWEPLGPLARAPYAEKVDMHREKKGEGEFVFGQNVGCHWVRLHVHLVLKKLICTGKKKQSPHP